LETSGGHGLGLLDGFKTSINRVLLVAEVHENFFEAALIVKCRLNLLKARAVIRKKIRTRRSATECSVITLQGIIKVLVLVEKAQLREWQWTFWKAYLCWIV
jgi:hypothetical protein